MTEARLSRGTVKALLVIVAGSLVLNLGYLVAFESAFTVSGDAPGYEHIALDLVAGKGFPVSDSWQPKREPGYPVFQAVIYLLRGHDPQAVRLVQGVIAASFCLLVFAAARAVRPFGDDSTVPLAAAVLAAAYPPFAFYAGALYRETLVTFFFLLALVAALRVLRDGRLRDVAWFGASAGLGALVDGRLLYFPVFLGGWWVVTRWELRRGVMVGALAFVVALAVISPWAVRNYVVLDRFVLLTTAPHKGLWIATSPEEFLEWDWTREPLKSLQALPTEEREREMARQAMDNLFKYPGTYVVSSFRRLGRLWLGGSHSNVMPLMVESLSVAATTHAWGYVLVKLLFINLQYAYVLGGFAGLALYLWRFGPGSVTPLLAVLVYLSIVHMLLFATPRYNLPAMPVLIVFLAHAVVTLRRRREAAPEMRTAGAMA